MTVPEITPLRSVPTSASWLPPTPGPGSAPGPGRPGGDPPAPTVAPSWFHEDPAASDIRGRLLERRVVLVGGHLDEHLATQVAAELMFLDGTGDDDIELHLSCPDGDLTAANALADTIDLVGVRVVARSRGTVGGPALGPFTAADHRVASPLSAFHLRDPSVGSTGSADELAAFAQRHRHELDALHGRIARATGRPVDAVATDFAAGTILDADEARRAGIVHEVQRAVAAPVTRLPGGR